jgi:hypothetical protein
MTDLTELVKALGVLRDTALAVIAGLTVLWIVVALLRSWMAYRNRERLEDLARKEKAEALTREEAREHRLGERLDAINDRTITMCETTIKSNTEALVKFTDVIKKCHGPEGSGIQGAVK